MPSAYTEIIPTLDLSRLIHCIRNQRVILDSDLAQIYQVPTKRLNEQLRRNRDRFPEDFAFRLTQDEWLTLRSRSPTIDVLQRRMRSQIATASKRNLSLPPFAFTEHGALMAANILNSRRATAMSIYVIRA